MTQSSSILWNRGSLQQALAPLGCAMIRPTPINATRVVTDSRVVQAGDLFIARRGAQIDGSIFVAEALAKGAAAVISEKSATDLGLSPAEAERLLIVSDADAALGALASHARNRSSAKLVAITGSVGKTSTKTMLAEVLGHFGTTHSSQGGYNNHVGVPLTLANLPIGAAYAVVEIGMNHGGEIAPLSRLARPHIAMVTTVEAVHLENFADIQGIADAKAEIFAGLLAGGTAILNDDNVFYDYLDEQAKLAGAGNIISFGLRNGTPVLAVDGQDLPDHPELGLNLDHGIAWQSVQLASLAAALALKLPLDQVLEWIRPMQPLAGRGRLIELPWPAATAADGDNPTLQLIDDSYNASPVSVQAAIQRLGQIPIPPHGRRILVLGDMRELGAQEVQLHVDLAAHIEVNHIDLVFTSGKLANHLFEALPAEKRGASHPDPALLAQILLPILRSGDAVTVKGSRGSQPTARMAAVVTAIQQWANQG